MGSTHPKAYSDEGPIHKVTLSAFCMDRTEVTLDAYDACVKAKKCAPHSGAGYITCGRLPEHSGRPINCVSWEHADAYCKAQGGRLPTEAEWEYAARGTDGRLYPWGNEPPDRSRFWAGDWDDQICNGCPTKVGQFPKGASPFGVLDMIGNVNEWVADYAADYPTDLQTNPHIKIAPDPNHPRRSIRGGHGGFDPTDASESRASRRHDTPGNWTRFSIGFRCAKSLTP
jgi:formylglycine-generating enzyme required for sulfatase activity